MSTATPGTLRSFTPDLRRRLTVCAVFGAGALAIAVLYWQAIPFPFQFDDVTNLVDNPSIRIPSLTLRSILGATTGTFEVAGGNRPLAFYTFAINYHFGGLDPWGYRFVNVLIHIGNFCLVYALIAALHRAASGREAGPWLAGVAALLWAVHPVQTNAVANVVQRMTSLATLLYLAGLLAYIRGRRRNSVPWLFGSALLFLLACATKEIAWVFPFTLILWESAFSTGLRSWLNRKHWAIALFLLACLSLFPLALYRYSGGYASYPFGWAERVLTEGRVVAHYLGLLVAPHPSRLVADYDFPLSTSLLSPPSTLLALAFHAAALAAGAYSLLRKPLYGFAILGFYLHLVLESTVIPLDLAFEHRLYLPSVFLAAGVAGASGEESVRRVLGHGGLRAAFAAGILLASLWGAWTWQRLQVWRDPIAFWTDVVVKQPGNVRAHTNLGTGYYSGGDFEKARLHLGRAVQLNPAAHLAMANLALLESDAGNHRQALEIFQQLLRSGYRHPLVYLNLGVVQWRLGMLREAAASIQTAQSHEPLLAGANYKLGEISLTLGDPAAARRYAYRELELYPGDPDAKDLLRRIDLPGAQ